jgi:uncharacterized protein (TIGR02145 family)
MIIIKALLTGLTGASLCIADISGIVTDTGSIPLSGALVQLENGGQKSTTGTDGRFVLALNTAIPRNENYLSLAQSPAITVDNGTLCLNLKLKTAVEIVAHNLNGKSLSIVRRTMDAGTNKITLPFLGTGIFVYKVKVGNGESILKVNAVGRTATWCAAVFHTSSLKASSKRAASNGPMNDVLSAAKTGYLHYRVVIGNPDTSGIAIKMIASAGTITDTDGNSYQTVRIGSQVWTVENLMVAAYNDGSPIPFDTSTKAWIDAETPKYCFYRNTADPDSMKKYGALYNWYVISPENPKKIAPAGWHVPSDADWDNLQNYLIANGYNWDGTTVANKIGKSLAAKTDWQTNTTMGTIGCGLTLNNGSGFTALGGGYLLYLGNFTGRGSYGRWWSVVEQDTMSAWYRHLDFNWSDLHRSSNSKRSGFSIRLVRDN